MFTYFQSEGLDSAKFINKFTYNKFEKKLLQPKPFYEEESIFSSQFDKIQCEFIKYEIPQDKYMYHDGYIEYLMAAYMNEHGIEISPWYFWNVILSQICEMVKKDVKSFRHIFTKSNDKITIDQDSPEIDIHSLISTIIELCPTNLKMFLPKFDNSPDQYDICMKGLLADMVQNYYSCLVRGCCIPKIRVLGSLNEWQLLVETVKNVQQLFLNINNKMDSYLDKVLKYLEECVEHIDDKDFWNNFFYVENCGSGSDQEISGCIKKLLLNKTYLVYELPSMISRYPFVSKCMQEIRNKVRCNFLSGIMFSHLDDENILVPEYHYTITYMDEKLTTERMYKKVLREFTQYVSFKTPNDYNIHDKYNLSKVLNHLGANPTIEEMNEFIEKFDEYKKIYEEHKVEYRCPNYDKCNGLGYLIRMAGTYGKLCEHCRQKVDEEDKKKMIESAKLEEKGLKDCYNKIKKGKYTFMRYRITNSDTGYTKSYCSYCINNCINQKPNKEELCRDKEIHDFCFCTKCDDEEISWM